MNAIPLSCVADGSADGAGGAGGSAGTGGSATAGTGGSATAGTGGSATAGTGGGTAGTGGTTPPMCIEGTNGAACSTCTMDNCALGPAPGTDGCCGLTDPADATLCQAVYACIQQNTATCTSGGDPTQCFCGTSGTMCFTTAGAANGPCVNQYLAASKTTDPVTIRARFTSPLFPSGRATNLSSCQGGLCAECGLQ